MSAPTLSQPESRTEVIPEISSAEKESSESLLLAFPTRGLAIMTRGEKLVPLTTSESLWAEIFSL